MTTLRTTKVTITSDDDKFTTVKVPKARRTSTLILDAKGGPASLDKTPEQRLADVLRAKHPLYTQMEHLWNVYRTVYEGLNVKQFIYKHTRESKKSMEERKKRSYYLNYVNQVVDIYAGFIYRQPITRELTFENEQEGKKFKEIFDHILDNFDSSGKRTVDEFWKTTSTWNMVLGTQFVLVDMPSDVPDTFEEQKKQKAYPFAVRIDPMRVVNWEVDTKGELLWVRLLEEQPPIDDPFADEILKEETEAEYYKTWTRNEWIRHKVVETAMSAYEAQELGRGRHDLEVVPLVPVRSKLYSESSIIGLSFIHDIASTSIAILNVCSLMDEEVYQKVMTLLAVQNVTNDQPAEINIGSDNVLSYTGDKQPNFISPSIEPGNFFQELTEKLGQEIFRMGKLGGGTAVLQEAMSGIAHAYLFNETNQSLADQADNMQEAEVKVLDLIRRWLSIKEDALSISVKYPDEFGIVKVTDELNILKEVKDVIPSLTLYKQLAKEVSQVLLQGVEDRKLVDEVMEEIEKGLKELLPEEVDEEGNEIVDEDTKKKKEGSQRPKADKKGKSAKEEQ